MRTIYYFILFFFAAVMLLAMFSFVETTGNFLYGGVVILLLILQTIFGGLLIGKSAHNEELVKTYREAETLYKDIIKIEREHNKELNKITDNVLEANTRVNNDQINLNTIIKDNLKYTRELIIDEYRNNRLLLDRLSKKPGRPIRKIVQRKRMSVLK